MIYTPWYTLFTKCPHFAKLDIHIFRKVHSLHWVYMVRVCKIIIVHSKTMLSPLPHLLFLALTIYSSSFFFFSIDRFRAKFENMGSMDILRFLICIILLITLIKLTAADLCDSCQSTNGVCAFDSSGAFACRCNGIMHHINCNGQDN